MNKELIMVFLPGISWILFALGGTQISDKVPGWKGWRRFILPAVYFLFCLLASWWQALIVTAIAVAVYSLGYGEKHPWWQKILVGIGYGLISVAIGISWWNLFTAVGFSVLFWLSNFKWTAKTWPWALCCGFFGLLCGIQVAYVLTGSGIVW
jgi:hypothetical protein